MPPHQSLLQDMWVDVEYVLTRQWHLQGGGELKGKGFDRHLSRDPTSSFWLLASFVYSIVATSNCTTRLLLGGIEVKFQELEVPGVRLLTSDRHGEKGDCLSEVYNKREMQTAGIQDTFVQDNHSRSAARGTMHGLHCQIPPHRTAKPIRVIRGAAYDIAVVCQTA